MDALTIDVLYEIWNHIAWADTPAFALSSRLIYVAGKSRIATYQKYRVVVLQNHLDEKSDARDYLEAVVRRPEIAEIAERLEFHWCHPGRKPELWIPGSSLTNAWEEVLSSVIPENFGHDDSVPSFQQFAWYVPRKFSRRLAELCEKGNPVYLFLLILSLMNKLKVLIILDGGLLRKLFLRSSRANLILGKLRRSGFASNVSSPRLRNLQVVQFENTGKGLDPSERGLKYSASDFFVRLFIAWPSLRSMTMSNIDLAHTLEWFPDANNPAPLERITLTYSHVTLASLKKLLKLFPTLLALIVSTDGIERYRDQRRITMKLSAVVALVEEHGRCLEEYEFVLVARSTEVKAVKRQGRWSRSFINTSGCLAAAMATTPSAEEISWVEIGELAFVPEVSESTARSLQIMENQLVGSASGPNANMAVTGTDGEPGRGQMKAGFPATSSEEEA